MFRFISFGSGSSGNCYLLYTDTDGLMIDCGVGIRKLKNYFNSFGLKAQKVNNILITHDHADHVRSVGSFATKYNIPVYTTKEVYEGISGNYCVRRKVPFELQHCIEKGKTFELGDFRIIPFGVPHDSTDCVGYSIQLGDIVFSIITDCGHITDEITPIITRSNYLVIEANHDPEMLKTGPYPEHLKQRIAGPCGHLPNNECGEALAAYATDRLRHIWLCHLSEENNHPELARKTVEQILKDKGISVGDHLKLDVLKRTSPGEIVDLL